MKKIYSLTGFGRFQTKNFKITIKSYNHRFQEIVIQMPEFLNEYEQQIKDLVQKKTKRGKIFVKIETNQFLFPVKFKLNKEFLKKYIKIFENYFPEIKEIPFNLIPKDSFLIWEIEIPKKKIEELKKCLNNSLKNFLKSKNEEGKKIQRSLLKISKTLEKKLIIIDNMFQKNPKKIYEDYKKQIEKLFDDLNISKERIIEEAVSLAIKADAKEEICRAKQFVERIIEKLKEPQENLGKELDFITQEILRELQTLSQKVKDIKIKKEVLKCKILNEQIKEQVQNLE